MRVKLETTEWVDCGELNHLYLFCEKDRIAAYCPVDGESWVIFKKPLRIDTKRRKFKELKKFPIPSQFVGV